MGSGAVKSTYESLTIAGYVPEQGLQQRKAISVKEKGKRYLLLTPNQEESTAFAIDGYIIKQGIRCDKLILVKRSIEEDSSEHWTESFVELKGTDIQHAIEQLFETLKNPLFKHLSNDVIRARIIGCSFPSNKSNPIMERAKQQFRTLFHCDLRSLKCGQNDTL